MDPGAEPLAAGKTLVDNVVGSFHRILGIGEKHVSWREVPMLMFDFTTQSPRLVLQMCPSIVYATRQNECPLFSLPCAVSSLSLLPVHRCPWNC